MNCVGIFVQSMSSPSSLGVRVSGISCLSTFEGTHLRI